MSSRIGGTIATFLMSVPISAVGLMAAFGPPDSVPGSILRKFSQEWLQQGEKTTSKSDEELFDESFDEDAPDFVNSDSEDKSELSQGDGDSVFAETDHDHDKSHLSIPDKQKASSRDDLVASVEQDPKPRAFGSGTNPETPLTWEQAARRFEEMGITEYHIERGAVASDWLFVCTMTPPGDDARIVRRFEAEAHDPLAAASDVLSQVDRWLLGRFKPYAMTR